MEVARSSRLLLRTLQPDDRDQIVAMLVAGQSVDRWSPPLAPGTTLDQMVDRWLSADPARHVRLVAQRRDGSDGPQLTNVIGMTDIVRGVFQNAYIGWRTHPALVQRGYCTEAVRLALQYAFADEGLKLHRVQASILADNVASCRVAAKCGFRLEGVAQRYLHIREQWRDHLIYALTADELALSPAIPPEVTEYWQRFLRSQAETYRPPASFEAFQFGDTPELADRLAARVHQGTKTATCQSLWSYEATGEQVPTVGSVSIVLDGQQRPVAVIEVIEVALRRFDQIDEPFAFEEGGGDRSLAHWRSAHRSYFARTLPKIGREFSLEMPLVCERFRVVWK